MPDFIFLFLYSGSNILLLTAARLVYDVTESKC